MALGLYRLGRFQLLTLSLIHISQVLYYWRVHAGSTSGGTDAKPYVAAAAKKALADHLARTGRTGTVEDCLFPSTYPVSYTHLDVYKRQMYTMDPTNIQPVTRYFSQQDKMRIGSSRYYISSILG